METYVTIIVPYSISHTPLMPRAVLSALRQTVPVCVLAIRDDLARGPGALRNYGASIAPTPFVTFLDADDTLHPTFIETCLGAWQQGHYVYTDHNGGRGRFHAVRPGCIWRGGAWHVITTLLPTGDVQRVGFDELLTGGEDGDFYRRLRLAGVCGVHIPQALMEYRAEGQRSVKWTESAAYQRDMKRQAELYSEAVMSDGEKCGTCGGGGNVDMDIAPLGEPREGWVLARAMWGGNRSQHGLSTGRLYARTGNGALIYVDARDVDGTLFERATPQQSEEFKRLSGVREVGAWLFNASDAPYNPFAAGDEPVSTERGDFAEQLKLARLD